MRRMQKPRVKRAGQRTKSLLLLTTVCTPVVVCSVHEITCAYASASFDVMVSEERSFTKLKSVDVTLTVQLPLSFCGGSGQREWW